MAEVPFPISLESFIAFDNRLLDKWVTCELRSTVSTLLSLNLLVATTLLMKSAILIVTTGDTSSSGASSQVSRIWPPIPVAQQCLSKVKVLNSFFLLDVRKLTVPLLSKVYCLEMGFPVVGAYCSLSENFHLKNCRRCHIKWCLIHLPATFVVSLFKSDKGWSVSWVGLPAYSADRP